MDPQVREKVQDFLSNVRQIPTLPDVYMKVKKVVEDPTMSVEYLADAIRFDQSLTVSILRLANSPFFGFRQKISSINQAIMLLGLREVYSLVLSVSVMGLFPSQAGESEKLFPARLFWEHSLGVAITARIFGSLISYPHPEELFVAGLIHDIGKLIEKMYLGDKFITLCNRAREEERFFLEIEVEELGFTHAEVGQLLCETWRFPKFLTDAVAYHHQPAGVIDSASTSGVAIVHVADSLVRALGLGWSGDPFVTPVDADALKILHLIPFNDLPVIIGRIRKEYSAATSVLMT